MSPVRIDISAVSSLAVCADCDWRAVHPTLSGAWLAAARHRRLDHEDTTGGHAAIRAAREARRREDDRIRAIRRQPSTHGTPCHSA